MNLRKYIEVKYETPGFHNWPNAPQDVNFLSSRHRHNFIFKVKIEVSHNDRDYEFFLVQEKISRYLNIHYSNGGLGLEFEDKSCEMIAEELFMYLYDNGNADIKSVSVSEDGENTGIVEHG